MIREITGMLVIAIAIENTSTNEVDVAVGAPQALLVDHLRDAEAGDERDAHAGCEHGRDGAPLTAVKHACEAPTRR